MNKKASIAITMQTSIQISSKDAIKASKKGEEWGSTMERANFKEIT